MDKQHAKYPYGFLISFDSIFFDRNIPIGFKTIKREYTLSYDKHLNFSEYQIDNVSVCVLGDIYSIFKSLTKNDISKKLTEALSKSEKDFFYLLKEMWGRFLIIYTNKSKKTYLLTDATSMRSLFYTMDSSPICSSHPYLLSKKKDDNYNFPIKYGYPGNLTPLKKVKILTPNTRILLNNGKISRFFPGLMQIEKERKSVIDVTNSFIKASEIILRQLIEDNKKICISLTGGLDSRITFALLKLAIPDNLDKIRFITYKNHKITNFDKDIEISKIIAKNYDLNHFIFSREEYVNKKLANSSHFSTYYHSGVGYLSGYEEIIGSDYIHIRSNIYEIGRAYYQGIDWSKKLYKGDNISEELSNIYLRSLGNIQKINTFYDNKKKEDMYYVFNEFFKEIEIEKTFEFFHPLDIFYWEHRMGTWMPHVYLETDFVFNTLSLPNNWIFLENFLHINEKDRLEATVFNRILELSDKFLVDLPINPSNKKSIDGYIKEKSIKEHFLFEKYKWFSNNDNAIQKISFNKSNLFIEMKDYRTLYFTSGGTSVSTIGKNKENYTMEGVIKIEFTIDIDNFNCEVDFFVLEFNNDSKKISGKSFNLKNGTTNILHIMNLKSSYLKLSFRLNSLKEDDLSSFVVNYFNIKLVK